jgi:hypothetical protein
MNEEATEPPNISTREGIINYITNNPDQEIYLDNPKGSAKAFGANEKTRLPFDYGEWPQLINPADNMGWDLIIVPSATQQDPNLIPVGYLAYSNTRPEKLGNDKIIIAPDGNYTQNDKTIIEDFFLGFGSFEPAVWLRESEQLEVDKEGYVTLYHVGVENLEELDPELAEKGRSQYSKAEFRTWDRPRVFFFTKMGQEDPGLGRISGTPYTAKIKLDKLYPINEDPLKLSYPEMREKFQEITGLDSYNPRENNVYERVATLAEELYGYEGFIYPHGDDTIVTIWKKTPVTRIDTFYGG